MKTWTLPSLQKYLIVIVNSYLLVANLLIFIKPAEENYLNLDNHFSIVTLFVIVLLSSLVLFFIDKRWQLVNQKYLFIYLLLFYFFYNALYTDSILISIGFSFFLFGLYFYLTLNNHSISQLSLFAIVIVCIRVIFMFAKNEFPNINKFSINLSEINISRYVIVILASCICFLLASVLFSKKEFGALLEKNRKYFVIGLSVIFLAYVFFVSFLMWSRTATYTSPNFDMGIFSQAYANMAKGLGPMTTLERDRELSHFAVHVSPILYILLPFYQLWPGPLFLNVAQVVLTLSGVIPLYLILKEFNFNQVLHILILSLYIFFPTLTTSHFYDFHENFFLAPMLLWLLYSNIKGWKIWGLLFTILTLFIKEDAAIYVLTMYFYFFFQNRFSLYHKSRLFYTLTQGFLPVIYFIICIYWLQTYGNGAMTGRFTNFMHPGQTSLLDVIINTLTNPTFVLSSVFIQRKLSYIFLILACLSFLPLMQKNWINYILMIPFFVINLFSDYLYQVDFGKQYNYGSNVLLIFMAILALEGIIDNRERINWVKRDFIARTLILNAVLISFFVLVSYVIPKMYTMTAYVERSEYFQQVDQDLQKIPRDSKVLAYSFYTPHLSDIYYLYDIFYHDNGNVDSEIDYIVVPRTLLDKVDSKEIQILNEYYGAGYEECVISTERVYILCKKNE